ncbi:unnamed protein product [Paramecium sonneborni]|uniref:Transmembrane protein n=1 Tax=Paramecium sonneborni TaxID=65129 RepID=A0A8S1QYY0_9CILI|nr:unnamed protein product [Paramecium sonneborni]
MKHNIHNPKEHSPSNQLLFKRSKESFFIFFGIIGVWMKINTKNTQSLQPQVQLTDKILIFLLSVIFLETYANEFYYTRKVKILENDKQECECQSLDNILLEIHFNGIIDEYSNYTFSKKCYL